MSRMVPIEALEQAHADLEMLAALLDVVDDAVCVDLSLPAQQAMAGVVRLAKLARDAAQAALG